MLKVSYLLMNIYNTGAVKNLYIHLYGFHLVLDLMKLVSGNWKEMILNIILENNNREVGIEHTKQLSIINTKYSYQKCLNTGCLIIINHVTYSVFLKFIDNSAVQCSMSYADICKNINVKQKNKEDITKEEKRSMVSTF